MKAHSYTPEHQYSIDEFVGHFDHFVRSPEGTKGDALVRYFVANYPNQSEGRYKMNRFGMAFSYLIQHLNDFERFVVVGGERKVLVSKPLVVALARYFGPIPGEHLTDDPDFDVISALASEEDV